MTNADLIDLCLQGDEAAWQQLVDRYSRLVHSVPVRHGLTASEVDDVGQEVFLAFAQNLHQIEDPERIAGWLATTARQLSWRAIQKRQREEPAEADDISNLTGQSIGSQPVTTLSTFAPSVDDLLRGWHNQEIIQSGFRKLNKRCCTLLTLIFLDPKEPSYDDIANLLGIPKGSIGPTRNRCLKQLRSILEQLGFSA